MGPRVGESRIRTNWFTRERRVVQCQCGQEEVDPLNRSLVFLHGIKGEPTLANNVKQSLDVDFIGRFIKIQPVFSSGPDISVGSNRARFAPPFPFAPLRIVVSPSTCRRMTQRQRQTHVNYAG